MRSSRRIGRRGFLAGSGAAALALTAGCLGPLGGDGPTFEADQATVPDAAREETGYREAEVGTVAIERTFEVGDQGQSVEVINWQAEYDRAIELGPIGEERAAVLAVLSTPQVDVLGRTFNPVADMSTREIVDLAQDRYEDLGELTEEETSPITVLGEETNQTRFAGEGTLVGGATVDIYLHASEAVASGDDLVIAIAAYPQALPDEEDRVLSMIEQIEHDAD